MYVIYFRCTLDNYIVQSLSDAKIDKSIPHIKRYYTTLCAFKFYTSDFVLFHCSLKSCPESSTDCDIVCSCIEICTCIMYGILVPVRYIWITNYVDPTVYVAILFALANAEHLVLWTIPYHNGFNIRVDMNEKLVQWYTGYWLPDIDQFYKNRLAAFKLIPLVCWHMVVQYFLTHGSNVVMFRFQCTWLRTAIRNHWTCLCPTTVVEGASRITLVCLSVPIS